MTFLAVIFALALVQWWGSASPLHHDHWYLRWHDWLAQRPALQRLAGLAPAIAVVVPVLLVGLLAWWSRDWLFGLGWLLIAVPVLLYSLGRGDFNQLLQRYIESWQREDFQAAYHEAQDFHLTTSESRAEDWRTLYQESVAAIGYRAFERLFAVLFWFVLAGPAGALLYRLLQLSRVQAAPGSMLSQRLNDTLWALEWLPLRLFGLTLALAGHFVRCFDCWQASWRDWRRSAPALLRLWIQAALGDRGEPPLADDDALRESHHELQEIRGLFTRSLVIWVTLLALWTLF